MRIWFSADLHLGHNNIRRYCERPFASLEEMNTTLITNWNERVAPLDIAYHVGDFCFRNSPGGKEGEGALNKADFYQSQLNGRIVFIAGNHDRNNSLKTPIQKVYIRFGGKNICLIHNPDYADLKCELNLVGHVHNNWMVKQVGNSILYNVGVDVNNFRPVSYEEINSNISKWKNSKKDVSKT